MAAVTKQDLSIGFIGLGTVGQGVWKHLTRHRAVLERRIGASLTLARVAVRDTSRVRDVSLPAGVLTDRIDEVVDDPSIDIICELMGGTGLAKEVTLRALGSGKTVVSANKALFCEHGREILRTAEAGGGHYFFEASVAGGIPVIKALHEGLVANRFSDIHGILNGTSNYILTRMEREGLTFEHTVGAARELGYVEADESLDLDGWDAAHKLVILAYLAHGAWFSMDQVRVEGIRRVTLEDIRAAAELGYRIKLLARGVRDFETNEVALSVRPTLVPLQSIIAGVNDVFNGISLRGDVAGTTFLMGRGAGQDATASAVISDIVDAGWSIVRKNFGSGVGPSNEAGDQCRPAAPTSVESCYYLRLRVRDEPGVLAEIARLMATASISISTLIQRPLVDEAAATLIVTTHLSNDAAIQDFLERLSGVGKVLAEPVCFPIFEAADA